MTLNALPASKEHAANQKTLSDEKVPVPTDADSIASISQTPFHHPSGRSACCGCDITQYWDDCYRTGCPCGEPCEDDEQNTLVTGPMSRHTADDNCTHFVSGKRGGIPESSHIGQEPESSQAPSYFSAK